MTAKRMLTLYSEGVGIEVEFIGTPNAEQLRSLLAFAKRMAPPPEQPNIPQGNGLSSPGGPRLAWNDDPANLAANSRRAR